VGRAHGVVTLTGVGGGSAVLARRGRVGSGRVGKRGWISRRLGGQRRGEEWTAKSGGCQGEGGAYGEVFAREGWMVVVLGGAVGQSGKWGAGAEV
jgi:hypothetical protein